MDMMAVIMKINHLSKVNLGQCFVKKTNLYALVLTSSFLISHSANAAVIANEDFSYSAADLASNSIGFTASEANPGNPTGLFHDGASDYFTIANVSGSPLSGAANTSTPFSGFDGQYFIAEDIDDGSSRPGSQTLSFNTVVTGFTSLSFDMLFAAGGNDGSPAYDSNDGFLVRAQLDGGAFQNLLAFEASGTTNQLLRQDTNFDGTGDGFQPSAAATAFNNLAISGTGTNLLLEIIVSSNDGNGEFAFDSLVFNGDPVPEPSSSLLSMLAGLVFVTRRRR